VLILAAGAALKRGVRLMLAAILLAMRLAL